LEAKTREDPAMRIATVSVDFRANLAIYLSLIVGAGGILFDFLHPSGIAIVLGAADGKDGEAVRGWKSGGKPPHSQIKLLVSNNCHAPPTFL
jgi:hypothetical protein